MLTTSPNKSNKKALINYIFYVFNLLSKPLWEAIHLQNNPKIVNYFVYVTVSAPAKTCIFTGRILRLAFPTKHIRTSDKSISEHSLLYYNVSNMCMYV